MMMGVVVVPASVWLRPPMPFSPLVAALHPSLCVSCNISNSNNT